MNRKLSQWLLLLRERIYTQMNLKKVLSPATVWVDLKANTKQGIIEEMVDRLIAAGKILDRENAVKAIVEREEKMSTGMQNGVAIPHGKTDSVDELIVAIGLNKDGVSFESIDGDPSFIFIMTLSPIKRRGPHMQFLAEISRLIGKASVREKLRQCKTNNGIYELLTEK